MVYRSPSRSNTRVDPSGLRSSEIHDPEVKVSLRVRVGSSGKPSCRTLVPLSSASWARTGDGAAEPISRHPRARDERRREKIFMTTVCPMERE
jgi:hypothetical protein